MLQAACPADKTHGENTMKILTKFIILMLPAMASAQNFQNMSEADMQNMMQQAQKMQARPSKKALPSPGKYPAMNP